MWQQEVRNYHDETYYLFNDALNNYMNRLQKIYNRGMIEAWVDVGELESRSPWSMAKTREYLEQLPNPGDTTERQIWLAGWNSVKAESAPVPAPRMIFELPVDEELEVVEPELETVS